MTTVVNLTLFKGDTKVITGVISDTNNTPIDITGCIIEWMLGANVLVKTTENGSITVTNAINGAYSFTITSDESFELDGQYTHEVDLIDTVGNRTTVTVGTIAVIEQTAPSLYATVEQANDYFSRRLFVDEWDASTATDKEKALYMATAKIDMQPLVGRKVDPTQKLQFPRSIYVDTPFMNPYYDPLKGNIPVYPGWYNEQEISPDVIYAACEEALAIIRHAGVANNRAELQRQGVKSFRLGNLSESFIGGYSGYRLLSVEAAQLLSRYIGGSRAIV